MTRAKTGQVNVGQVVMYGFMQGGSVYFGTFDVLRYFDVRILVHLMSYAIFVR